MEEKNIENKEEAKNETQEIKRPWQGNVWIISFGVLFSIIWILISNGVIWITGPIYDLFKVITFLISLVGFGFWKGWKWTVFIAIIISILDILNVLFKVVFVYENLNLIWYFIPLLSLVFSGFMLYLSIACIKHPFYNQKKVGQKS